MSLPVGLEKPIEQAEEAMLDDPDHTLRPFYREAIYDEIDALAGSAARRVRGWLAVLTAEFVLPVWQRLSTGG